MIRYTYNDSIDVDYNVDANKVRDLILTIDGMKEHFPPEYGYNMIFEAFDTAVIEYGNLKNEDILYEELDELSRKWIRLYTIALVKEIIGIITDMYPIFNYTMCMNPPPNIIRESAQRWMLHLKSDLTLSNGEYVW